MPRRFTLSYLSGTIVGSLMVAGLGLLPLSAAAQGVATSSQGGVAAGAAPTVIDMATVPQASPLAAPPTKQPPRPQNGLSDTEYSAAKAVAGRRAGTAPTGGGMPVPTIQRGASETPGAVTFTANSESQCLFFDPSDQALAVGDQNVGIVQVDNSCFSVYDRSGNLQAGYPKSLNSFFGAPSNQFIFDPRALYDWVNGRYIIVASAQNTSNGTGTYWIAVSTSDVPTGSWFIYHLSMPTGGSGFFPDYPRVGQDSQAIYVASNKFTNGDVYQFEEWLFLPKAAMYAGSGFSYNFQFGMTVGGVATDGSQPANVWNIGDHPRAEFFVTSKNINDGGGQCQGGCNGLTIWAVSNPLVASGSPGQEVTGVVVATANNYSLPPAASQPGGANTVDTGDTRISGEVTYLAGSLYAAHSTNVGGRVGALTYQIHPTLNNNDSRCTGAFTNMCPQITAATITNEALFFYADTTASIFYPTQQPDPEGNVTMVFNFSNSTTFPSTAYQSRRTTQAVGTWPDSGVFAAVGSAFKSGRWGDYTAVAPAGIGSVTSISKMYFAGQFSNGSGTWGTVIGNNHYSSPNQP